MSEVLAAEAQRKPLTVIFWDAIRELAKLDGCDARPLADVALLEHLDEPRALVLVNLTSDSYTRGMLDALEIMRTAGIKCEVTE